MAKKIEPDPAFVLRLDKTIQKDISGPDRLIFTNDFGFKLIVPATEKLFTEEGIRELDKANMAITSLALTTIDY